MTERFFVDHGAIHDRVTGQHVGMHAEIEWQERLLKLLLELDHKGSSCDEAFSAERARREKAEEVVDFILRRPLVYSETSAWDICQEYRAQYPRVEQENDHE